MKDAPTFDPAAMSEAAARGATSARANGATASAGRLAASTDNAQAFENALGLYVTSFQVTRLEQFADLERAAVDWAARVQDLG